MSILGQPKKQFCVKGHDTDVVGRYKTNYECKECSRLPRTELKDHNRGLKYQSAFGITLAQYNEMFISQSGLCKGCYVHQSKVTRAFAVDHDHKTGKIRGLLCVNCNVALGNAKDSPIILRRLADYLDRNGDI